jgi:hypothetical protein
MQAWNWDSIQVQAAAGSTLTATCPVNLAETNC